MSSYSSEIATIGVTAAVTLYKVVDGELTYGLLVPALGYALHKTGKHYKSDTITSIGDTIIMATGLSLPGATIGHGIYAYGGKTLASKSIGVIMGCAVTYKIFDIVTGFLGNTVARNSVG